MTANFDPTNHIPEEVFENEFSIDTVQGSSILNAVQPDVLVTVQNQSFYFEVIAGKVTITYYHIGIDGVADSDGEIIYQKPLYETSNEIQK